MPLCPAPRFMTKRVIRRQRSQPRCLAKDSVAHIPMQRLPGPDMDLDPEQLLQVLNQPGMIQQTPAWLPRYQQIEVAALVGLASGNGAEYTQIVGAMPRGEPEDLFPPFRAQCVQGDHVSIVRQFQAAMTLSALVRRAFGLTKALEFSAPGGGGCGK